MTKQKGIKRLSVILVVAMLLSMIPATLGFAAEADTAKVEAFVTRLYEAALDRQPDAGGLNYWTNQLATHTQTAAQAISFILIESKEFQGKNLDDSAFLDTVYKAFFNRAADAGGKAFWTKKLEEGYSRRWVIQQMVGAMTGEFQRLCEEAGIVPGKVGGVTDKDLALLVTKVAATNDKTVVATFSKEVGSVLASNFSVNLKSDEFALSIIDSVTVKGNVVTIKLLDPLEDEEVYVLNIMNVPAKDGSVAKAASAEFEYKKQEAVSISVKYTTLAAGDELEYVIKDAAGNDITDNFDVSDITVESSNTNVVSETAPFVVGLDGKTTAYAIVNLKINDTDIESGNTIVTVKQTLQLLTTISRWTLSTGTIADPKTALFESDTEVTIVTELLDQDGEDFPAEDLAEVVYTYRSITPSILVVDEDGELYPVKAGTATVLITAELAGRKVSKYVTIQVKADPEAKSMAVSTTSVKLVEGSGISRKIEVKIYDQYGNVYDTDETLTYSINKAGILDGLDKDEEDTVSFENGVAEIELVPEEENPVKGTGTLTIKAGDFKKTVSVSLVAPASFVGYVAEAEDTKLDVFGNEADFGPSSTTVKVFAKDSNGNFIDELTVEDDDISLVSETPAKATVEGMTVTAVAAGTVKVNVFVGSAKIQTITFTIVDSEPVLTTVSQTKNAITVYDTEDDLVSVLFGSGTVADGDLVDGIFVGYDQYGDKIEIADAWQALSSNRSVIEKDTLDVVGEGTATLTIIINSKTYVITVKVVAAPAGV